LLDSTVHSVIQRRVHGRGEDGDLFGEIAAAVRDVPGRERERRRRVARMEDARIDDTHPPTGLRIRLLEERPPRAARVMLDAERYGVIDAELSRMRRSMHEHLIDAFRARLYA